MRDYATNVGSVWAEPTFVTSSLILRYQALSLLAIRLDISWLMLENIAIQLRMELKRAASGLQNVQ